MTAPFFSLSCPHCRKDIRVPLGGDPIAVKNALLEPPSEVIRVPGGAGDAPRKKRGLCACGHEWHEGRCQVAKDSVHPQCPCLKAHSRRGAKGAYLDTAPGKANGKEAGVSLSTGEGLILAAIVQRGDATNDELTAMLDYRETSLRTYLGNLRAAGYVESEGGRHRATQAGETHGSGYGQQKTGHDLFLWWTDQLSEGEAKILRLIYNFDTTHVAALVGPPTGLKETSVRTYVGHLLRRKLIVRADHGKVSLAPILKENA